MEQLEALVYLVEERSFSRAARKMFLTQPSLTKRIKNLEQVVNARIINRQNTGITLTPEGKVAYGYAKRILKLRDEAREKVSMVRDDASGNIFISASTIPATYILPQVLKSFSMSYPNIKIHIQTTDSEETLEMILDNRSEIGFIGKQSLNRKLISEPLWDDCLVLVVPKNHPWSKESLVTFESLCKEPFIMRERGSGTREVLEDYVLKNTGRGLAQFNVVCEVGSSEAVKEAVMVGLGVSILSIHAVKREVAKGDLVCIPIQDFSIRRNFYLIYKRQLHLSYHQRLFLEFVKDYKLLSSIGSLSCG
ncbi:MAG: selenium metabolism-associated LysR family transcriptional regulator [Thermodesulfobacteriota bacterium]|nr:selenium metabolism-associated LysR family transcriptional regulator [Thermodesulfobacteriota bacterium]